MPKIKYKSTNEDNYFIAIAYIQMMNKMCRHMMPF